MIYLQLLFLIVLANLAPVMGQRVFRHRFAYPLDCGVTFIDGRALLGSSKTWRGYLIAVPVTMSGAWAVGLNSHTGLVCSLAVLFGDTLTSFIKRRIRQDPGRHVPGLDQLLECLLPLLLVRDRFGLTLSGISAVVLVFAFLNLLFWRYYRRADVADCCPSAQAASAPIRDESTD
jgi:CDP-diglyceride synthetase